MIIGFSAAAVVLILGVGVFFAVNRASDDTIADGVRVGGVDVSGMERDQAGALIRRQLAGATGEPVAVLFHRTHYVLRADVAKARIDVDRTLDAALDADGGAVAPRVTFSRGGVQAFAGRIAQRVNRDARDADIAWRDGKLDRTRARAGVAVDRAALVTKIAGVLGETAAPQRTVQVPVKVTERPDRTFADLAKRYPRVIAVDRDAKILRLYENLKLTKRYKIAVGKAGLETAAGRYKIQEKIVNPDWHVPNSDWAGDLAGQTIPAGDPQNPLEARYMGFHDGQGIHGTAELSSLGTAASHGCIRMSVPSVKQLFKAVRVGTPVFMQ